MILKPNLLLPTQNNIDPHFNSLDFSLSNLQPFNLYICKSLNHFKYDHKQT